MPYYFFDLVVEDEFKNQGSIILEDLAVAADRADQLANELRQVKARVAGAGLCRSRDRRLCSRAVSHAA